MKTKQSNKTRSQKVPRVQQTQTKLKPRTQRLVTAPRSRTNLAPVAVGTSTHAQLSANSARVAVSGLVSTLAFVPGTKTGVPLLELNLNPLTWAGNRIAHEAQLWQQFRFTKLNFTVKPASSTLFGGAYVHAVELEPEGMAIEGVSGVQYLAALPGSAYSNIWSSSVATAPLNPTFRSQNWYKLDVHDEYHPDYSQGVYCVSLAEPVTGLSPDGSVTASVWVDGIVEFSGRRLPQLKLASDQHLVPRGTNYTLTQDAHGVALTFQGFDYTWMVDNRIYAVFPDTLISLSGQANTAVGFVIRRSSQNNSPYVFVTFNDARFNAVPMFENPGASLYEDLVLVDTGASTVSTFRGGQPSSGQNSAANAGIRLQAPGARPDARATGTNADSDSKPTEPAAGPDQRTDGGHCGGDRGEALLNRIMSSIASNDHVKQMVQRFIDDAVKSSGLVGSLAQAAIAAHTAADQVPAPPTVVAPPSPMDAQPRIQTSWLLPLAIGSTLAAAKTDNAV